MDVHKDCYSAIDLTQQDGPHRRETVQPKAITFPTDAKLLHAAIKGLNRLATRRQTYCRVANAAALMAGRYAHTLLLGLALISLDAVCYSTRLHFHIFNKYACTCSF
jgi:hypothetical protein